MIVILPQNGNSTLSAILHINFVSLYTHAIIKGNLSSCYRVWITTTLNGAKKLSPPTITDLDTMNIAPSFPYTHVYSLHRPPIKTFMVYLGHSQLLASRSISWIANQFSTRSLKADRRTTTVNCGPGIRVWEKGSVGWKMGSGGWRKGRRWETNSGGSWKKGRGWETNSGGDGSSFQLYGRRIPSAYQSPTRRKLSSEMSVNTTCKG